MDYQNKALFNIAFDEKKDTEIIYKYLQEQNLSLTLTSIKKKRPKLPTNISSLLVLNYATFLFASIFVAIPLLSRLVTSSLIVEVEAPTFTSVVIFGLNNSERKTRVCVIEIGR